MTTEEFTHPPTEKEARAAFVSRAAGAAADAGELIDRAAALLPSAVTGDRAPRTVGDEEDLNTLLAALAGHLAGRSCLGTVPPRSTVWGLDLDTGVLRRVPAERLAVPAGPPGHPPVGVAAGLTWVGALEAGMTAHCEALLARRLAEPGTRVPRLCLAGLCDGRCSANDCAKRATAASQPLYAAGEPVAHDLSGLLSLPGCAVRVGPRPDTVVATGATRAEAVRRATARALRALTAAEDRGPRPLPAIGPDQELPPPGAEPSARVHWSRPLDALRAQGRTPVAVLLDQDPRVNEVLPYLVHVVLLDGPR
ncbi:hypothetical protein [Streptomyces hyaluromycini]|uniref:hypothetical protein n=1 Tax=Streptomyces hyaluromycini TaxID=1377993 RepID=UPI000B5CD3A8|nr:hypothetical protein [Streptomyces hyaluromycini]